VHKGTPRPASTQPSTHFGFVKHVVQYPSIGSRPTFLRTGFSKSLLGDQNAGMAGSRESRYISTREWNSTRAPKMASAATKKKKAKSRALTNRLTGLEKLSLVGGT